MQKIKSVSHVLSQFFRGLCWLLPLIMSYFTLFHLEGALNIGVFSQVISSEKVQNAGYFSLTHRLFILLIEFLPLSITVLICHKLANLFRLYERGYLFEEENISLIKHVAIFMLIGQLIQLVYQPLITAALTLNNPAGERFASITLGTTNASTIITAIIMLVASWIIKEAQQLNVDSKLTI
ncbi:DUF2975 domain-containing protein [Legionella micdadei]|uniref:DUF2975 domain-containing protein n=1 Tax=Legionella micdadei TaxID=451 RepID=A0A098GHX0_LEGMI|nr:DUF2975 domain-containing protein [Legionella micdadei]ARG97009.1 hypothetical protein B6N58_04620 [Legionella micdadei]ARH00736.1 hypothetical protein B6V88_10080 [Legionella micdadei]KTD26724.1 hypothetical protein Lmic_2818 [Legionella micdadei]NSL18229.1 DUF2975 domain-containing protein [Legionella micdadei]CEG61577.1 conserved membrane protein of unknown function [Legionella micdadei]